MWFLWRQVSPRVIVLPWKQVYLHSTGPLKKEATCESLEVGGDDGVLQGLWVHLALSLPPHDSSGAWKTVATVCVAVPRTSLVCVI